MTPSQPSVPTGWHDDGTTLYAPNKIPVVHGFRDHVLTHSWDKENWPLAPETGRTPLEIGNPALGSGTQQIFRYSVLEWTAQRGVFVAWVGQELLAERESKPVLSQAALEPELRKQLAELAQALQSMWTAYTSIQEILKGK